MKDSVLLIVFLMISFFGYHMMDQVDRFLTEGYWQQGARPQAQPDRESLNLGFLDPMPAERMTKILERLTKRAPDMVLHLTSGTAEELMKGFSEDRYDLIFSMEGDEESVEGLWRQPFQPPIEQTAGGKRQWKVV